MLDFLSFPREIRDKILEQIPLLPRRAPHPSDLNKTDRMAVNDRYYSGAWEATTRVFFGKRQRLANPLLPLLLVSRQLHDETKDMMRRTIETKNPPDYVLDLVYLRDWTLWPTWLSVPRLADRIGTVYAQFRIFDALAHLATPVPDAGGRGMHQIGCGGPQRAVWLWYHVLVGFLRHGPAALDGQAEQRPVSVRALVLDFVTPEEGEGGAGLLPLGACPRNPWRLTKTDNPGDEPAVRDYYAPRCLDPEDEAPAQATEEKTLPALYLAYYVRRLLRMMAHFIHKYDLQGRILYETVGEVEFRLDGRPKWRVDIAAMLAEASSEGYATTHPEEHAECVRWKRGTVERRRRAGLPIRES
ncbi:Uu.00g139380.m01.CDS01 [Anthostomella pinea]|uniref:Uu.00g139380.m01.CDS01 n=1 Tax=Anthostomella pinea TaxID=933095 RepID=A0AAI8YL92_9PEZI|nr:Uu.00g139380.m01.CDS01 [Anthostomella pinea]